MGGRSAIAPSCFQSSRELPSDSGPAPAVRPPSVAPWGHTHTAGMLAKPRASWRTGLGVLSGLAAAPEEQALPQRGEQPGAGGILSWNGHDRQRHSCTPSLPPSCHSVVPLSSSAQGHAAAGTMVPCRLTASLSSPLSIRSFPNSSQAEEGADPAASVQGQPPPSMWQAVPQPPPTVLGCCWRDAHARPGISWRQEPQTFSRAGHAKSISHDHDRSRQHR